MADLFLHWVPSLAAGALLFLAVVFVVRFKLPWVISRVEKLEELSHEQEVTDTDLADVVKKKEIYDEDGQPHYQHVSGCKAVQSQFCSKIDGVKLDVAGVKEQLKEMDAAREEAKGDLIKVMTRVETMIEKDRTQELQSLADMIVNKFNGK